MLHLIRTDATHPDFQLLVKQLDADLAIRDGADHSFYAPFNTIDSIRHAIVAYTQAGEPVGCGAIKPFDEKSMEVKRMWVVPSHRGMGVASQILSALEKWATDLHFEKCVLETGMKQPEALALYAKNGYRIIENYGQYAGVENSVCFEKFVGEAK
jgi:putative acetyltransferase